MLQIIFPHALVLCPIHMFVDSTAIRLIVRPVAIVDISINVDESTFSMGSVLTPLTTVLGPVIPSLFAETIAEATLPLACVDSTSLEGVGSALFSLLVWIVSILRHRFTSLFHCEILAASDLLCTKK